MIDLDLDDLLGKAELRDPVHEHTAALVKGFKNRHVIALLAQVSSAGEPGGAGTHNRYPVSVGGRDLHRVLMPPGIVMVRHIALQAADGDALAFLAADAHAFALLLLRADTAADSRERVGGRQDLIGGFQIPFHDLLDEGRDPDGDRTADHAEGMPAVETAVCLGSGQLVGISEGDFVKILYTDSRILLRHFVLGQSHISHGLSCLLS